MDPVPITQSSPFTLSVDQQQKIEQLMQLCNQLSLQNPIAPQGPFTIFVNTQKYTLASVDPQMSLNTFIRSLPKHKGTKRSCGEGGCGACTVVMSTPGKQPWVSVNSCIRPLLACNGRHIITIEGIGGEKQGFSPLQTRLAEADGTQCGYCSPGFVMNMYSLLANNPAPTEKEVEEYFDGNLCRCTGYRPIYTAFKSFAVPGEEEHNHDHGEKKCSGKCSGSTAGEKHCKNVCKLSKTIPDIEEIPAPKKEAYAPKLPEIVSTPRPFATPQWQSPTSLSQVYNILSQNPNPGDVALVFGHTSWGIFKDWKPVIYVDLQFITELQGYSYQAWSNSIQFGASTTIAEFILALKTFQNGPGLSPVQKSIFPELIYMAHRVASTQIRNTGCIAGNLMLVYKHQFPSDLFTALASLNATLTIGSAQGDNVLGLLDFLNTDMSQSVVKYVNLPLGMLDQHYMVNKASMRNVFSHSLVNSGCNGTTAVVNNQTTLSYLTLIFGNIGDGPIRAKATESYLIGKPLSNKATLLNALKVLEGELIPTNKQPKGPYRKSVALNMFYKFYLSLIPGLVPPTLASGVGRLIRDVSKGEQSFQPHPDEFPVSKPVHKLKGVQQTSGAAQYTGDIPPPEGTVYAAFVQSTVANATISSIDASPALAMEGVIDWVSVDDIPGTNTCDLGVPIFADKTVSYYGQALGIVIATTQEIANEAVKVVKVNYINGKTPLLSIQDAISQKSFFDIPIPPIKLGDVDQGLKNSDVVLTGTVQFGPQYHFHIETQTCLAVPEEDQEMKVYAATQLTPSLQSCVANALNVAASKIYVEVKRCGGGYGGKLSNSEVVATACAIAANKLGVPVKTVLELEANMTMLGKRPVSLCKYSVGVMNNLTINALKFDVYTDAGTAPNDSVGTIGALLNTLDSCYSVPNYLATGTLCKTNQPANTSMRGPGWTPAIFFVETVIEHIANNFSIEPSTLRMINFFKQGQTTPGGTKLAYWNMDKIWDQLQATSDFQGRLAAVSEFNSQNQWKKKGLAMVPVRWGAFWSGDHQESLVTIYGDGTILVCHSGVEIGQGIDTKVCQTVAYKLGVDMSLITITNENTTTGPNNSGTGGSITSELCCASAALACDTLNTRLGPIKKLLGAGLTWKQIIQKALAAGIDLQARGNIVPGQGPNSPVFQYQSYSACVTEAEVDILTGESNLLRSDILFDCGISLSPLIDIGQIEGAFIMGLGLYLTEEMNVNSDGSLYQKNTWEYKPPTGLDIPLDLRVSLLKDAPNPVGFLSSKCTGEPPLALSCVGLFAVQHAISAFRRQQGLDVKNFIISSPLTVDVVQTACPVTLQDLTF